MKRLSYLVLMIAACSSPPVTDELAGETSADDTVVDQKADSPYAEAYTYYEIRQDLRKCAFPLCGGFFVSRLNRSATRCSDGSYADACYTPTLDPAPPQKLIDAAALDATTPGVYAIVRGWFDGNTFVTTEAWGAENPAVESDGVFVKIENSGIVCITAPCPTMVERGLNTIRFANISELDWTDSGLTDREIEGFQTDIAGDGMLAAGWRYYGSYNGHATKGRTITAAYHRIDN